MAANTILLLYVSVGYGHQKAAGALSAALSRNNPHLRTISLDILKLWNPGIVGGVCRLYQILIKMFPGIWERVYDDRELKRKLSGCFRMFYRLNRSRMTRLIDEFAPAAAVCTQALPCCLVADFKEATGHPLPLVAVPTDYVVHDYWLHEKVDLYLVPSPNSRDVLLVRGVDAGRIKVVGIPVHPDFSASHDSGSLREKYRLRSAAPIVLIMGGGKGSVPLTKLIRSLDRRSEKFQITAVAGRNLRLHSKLQLLKRELRHPLNVYSFIDSIDELMESADLIVTKPGGLTTSEALVKNLPMILVNPLPGQESRNAGFLEDQGVAIQAVDEREAAAQVGHLLNGSGNIERMKAAIKAVRKPVAAREAARQIVRLIDV